MVMTMVKQRIIKASEFKAKCLRLMDEVAETGEPVVITKNGKPVSKLVPIYEQRKTLFGALKDTIEIHGDIISPIDVEWEAEGAGPRHARARLDHVGQSIARSRVKGRHRKRVR
jgi:prevent-host-death family protein